MRKIGWFDIYVDDMDRAQRFYETVLETTLSPMDDPNDTSVQMRAFEDDFVSHGAGRCAGEARARFKPGPGGSMVYFTCDDCATELGSGGGRGRFDRPPQVPDRRARLRQPRHRHRRQHDRLPLPELIVVDRDQCTRATDWCPDHLNAANSAW